MDSSTYEKGQKFLVVRKGPSPHHCMRIGEIVRLMGTYRPEGMSNFGRLDSPFTQTINNSDVVSVGDMPDRCDLHEGQEFYITGDFAGMTHGLAIGSRVVLIEDDGSSAPGFCVYPCRFDSGAWYVGLEDVVPVYTAARAAEQRHAEPAAPDLKTFRVRFDDGAHELVKADRVNSSSGDLRFMQQDECVACFRNWRSWKVQGAEPDSVRKLPDTPAGRAGFAVGGPCCFPERLFGLPI